MNSPTPFDGVFNALEAALAVPCPREPHADAAGSQETRIVWTRSGAPKPEPSPYRRAGEETIGRLAHPWTATIYAPTDLEVSQLLAQLWAKLDRIVGPPQGSKDKDPSGYKFEPGKIVGIVGGDAQAASYSCDVAVTLYQSVARAVRPTATVERVTVAVAPQAPEALDAGSVSCQAG